MPQPQPFHRPPHAPGRSPHWSATRRAFLRDHPTCEACGGKTHLNAHHCLPFHLDPSRELDPSNLITLCESPKRLCHFAHGHCWDWKAFNPNVRQDAATALERFRGRKYE